MTGIAHQRQAIGKYTACHFYCKDHYTECYGNLQFILSRVHMSAGRQIAVTVFMIFVRVIAGHHNFSFSTCAGISLFGQMSSSRVSLSETETNCPTVHLLSSDAYTLLNHSIR
jgi:hypothetical protein